MTPAPRDLKVREDTRIPPPGTLHELLEPSVNRRRAWKAARGHKQADREGTGPATPAMANASNPRRLALAAHSEEELSQIMRKHPRGAARPGIRPPGGGI